MIFKSINPFTQIVLAEHEVLTNVQLSEKLKLSELAYKHWRTTAFQKRADKMKNLAWLRLFRLRIGNVLIFWPEKLKQEMFL